MTGHYEPACPACRAHDPSTFYAACGGCLARKDNIEYLRRAAANLTPCQFAGMDDMMPSDDAPPQEEIKP